MIFSKLRLWGLAIVGAVLSALVVIVKILTKRNSHLSRRAENAEAKAKRAVIIAEADRDIEQAKRKLRDEIKNTSTDDAFRNPGSLWNDRDDT